MAELKPCPFCGGKNISVNMAYGDFWYECKDCFCEGPSGDTQAEAIEAWNRRAEDV